MLDPICKQLKKELVKGRRIKLCNMRFPIKHNEFNWELPDKSKWKLPIGTWRKAVVAKIDKKKEIVFCCEYGLVSYCYYPWLDETLNVTKEDNLYIISDEFGELLKWEMGELGEFPCEEF